MVEKPSTRQQLVARLRALQRRTRPAPWRFGSATDDSRLHHALEIMRAVLVESGPDGRTLYVSPSVASVLGYAPEDFLNRESWDWVHEDDLQTLIDATGELQNHGQPVTVRFRVHHKAGHWLWLEATSSAYRTPEGEERTVTFARDVTEAKRTDEALRASDDRFRAVAANASDVIIEVDHEGRFLYVSPNCDKVLAAPAEELVGHTLAEFIASDLIHPEDQAPLQRGFGNTVASGRLSGNREFRFRHADGTWHWFDSQFTAYQTVEGAWRAVVISRDVTARVRAQQKLRESEERYRLITETAHEIIFETERPGRVVYASAAVRSVLGYESDEIIGMTPRELIHPEDLERCLAALDEGAHREAAVVPDPFRVRRRDGSYRWLEGQGIPFRRSDDALRFLFVLRDITERLLAEHERRRLEKQMEESQRLEGLGVMAGGIAHDFNNLLTPILGDASLALMDLPESSPLRQRLVKIQKAAQRAATLTNQMLAYAGKGPILMEPLDLTTLVREMAQLLESSIGRTAELVLDLAEDLPAVQGDTAQLSQVVMNLLTNASEAVGESGGCITIRTGCCDPGPAKAQAPRLGAELSGIECVCVEVRDDGSGMDDETRARIFDPFFTTKFTGRGLGLAAALGIVRSHGGAIEIDTAPKRGTRFRVLLPAARGVGAAVAADAPGAGDWRTTGTVLVVDDDHGVRELARDVLERTGLTVLCAADAASGIELFTEHADEVRAVVLDRTMPAGSGEEAFDRIRSLRSDVPIILASGYSEQRAAERFAEGELAGFLRKPFLPAALVDALRRALDG